MTRSLLQHLVGDAELEALFTDDTELAYAIADEGRNIVVPNEHQLGGKVLDASSEAVLAGLDAKTASENPWAVFDDYIDRVVIQCVNGLTPKWQDQLAAYDVYIWDQCYAMEQSLRID